MAATTNTPAATGSPSAAAPAAGATGAEHTDTTELDSVESALMADLTGETGTTQDAGEGDTDTETPETKDDASDDESEADEGQEEDDEDGEDDEQEGDDDDEEDGQTGETEGTPHGVRKALEKAGLAKGLLKRIDQAFKHNQTHRARVAELETELSQRGDPVVLAPTELHPLSDVTTAEQLAEREKAAEWWLNWCEDNPDGGTVGKGEQSREFTAADVKSQRKWANTVMRAAPERQRWIGARAEAGQVARAAFPEMFKKGTPEHTAAQALMKGTPELTQQPDYEISLADMVRGLKSRVLESQGWKFIAVPPDDKAGKKGKAAAAAQTTVGEGGSKTPVSPNSRRPAPAPAAAPAKPPGRNTAAGGGKPNLDSVAAEAAKTGNVDAMLAAELD